MSHLTRREFIRSTAATTGGFALAAMLGAQQRARAAGAVVNGVSPPLQKYIQPLRGFYGANPIPVAAADTATYPGVDYYRIVAGQYTDQLHPALPKPTRLYGYLDANNPVPRHLGGVIVAQQGRPVRVTFGHATGALQLPDAHIMPVDMSIPGAETGQAENRVAVHLHGGFVPWTSDGGPFHWFDPNNDDGPSAVGTAWLPDANGVLTNDYWYPNVDTGRLLWYHDHAVGLTRINAYAGLATAYLLVGADEEQLITSGAIPGANMPPLYRYGIPLVFQDKVFKQVADQWGAPGDLWYPSVYPANGKNLPVPSCVPEFFGDTMLCNGTAYPAVTVEQRRYRFRILNACQSAFLNLQLYYAKKGGTEANTSAPGPAMMQIGTEASFLPAPVIIPPQKISFSNQTGLPVKYSLLMGPGERADVIVDFSNVPAGSKLIMYSDAPHPFPAGAPPILPVTPGFGPDTANLLQFTVTASAPEPQPTNITLPGPKPAFPNITGLTPINKTLNEGLDAFGRLIQMIGTDVATAKGFYGRPYLDPGGPTETAHWGDVQVWDIYNLTADTHPMHFHLVNVQVIGRAPFDAKTPVFVPLAAFAPPDANEAGWKETVRMNPGQVTRVAMQFLQPPIPSAVVSGGYTYPVTLPTSPRTGGYEYVWHCHILEHEEHDMMRPLVVL